MTEDIAVREEPFNLCCARWKDKYSKLKEKQSKWEQSRDVLRQTVKFLEQQADRLQTENGNLKKACEEETIRTDNEKDEKKKELAIRLSLEKEISALKSEIFSLQQIGGSVAHDGDEELKLLRVHISDSEKEINKLKELLEKERMRADSEKKKAEAEKKKAQEAWKIVKKEKSRADEERKLANIEKKNAEEIRLQFETLKSETDEARSKLVSEACKFEETNKMLEAERQNKTKERERADLAMAKAEEQRKLAEINRKKAMDEKCHSDALSQQLEQDRRKIQELQMEVDKLVCFQKMIDVRAGLPAQQTNADTTSVRGELHLQKLKFEEADKNLQKVKQKAIREKKRADSEMRKAEEHRKVAEACRKSSVEEKHRADKLTGELLDYRRRIEELQREIRDLVSSRVEPPVVMPDKHRNNETSNVKLLRKQLKLEKSRIKHARQVAMLEISRTKLLRQELGRLKEEFIQFSQRLNLLENCFSCSNEGIDDLAKSLKFKKKLLAIEPYQMHLHCDHELGDPTCTSCTTMDAFNPLKQTTDCNASLLRKWRGNCPESITGRRCFFCHCFSPIGKRKIESKIKNVQVVW